MSKSPPPLPGARMTAEPQRQLILHMSVSLDGFVAHEDGGIDWLEPSGEHTAGHGGTRHHANLEMLGQIGLIVVGRVAYEQMAPAWSSSTSPMAERINALPKVVFSETLDAVDWQNARLNEQPLEEEVPRLKAEGGGDIVVFGGGRIGHSLLRARLVDELRLTVHPVALGSGISLMHGLPEPQRFELISATVYTDGTIGQLLRPARPVR
jgi:dihydrofolate reductase